MQGRKHRIRFFIYFEKKVAVGFSAASRVVIKSSKNNNSQCFMY